MPSQLTPITLNNPGSKGLNSQASSTTLDSGWATVLDNAVFDLNGRATSRKGWTKLTTSGSPGNLDFASIHCYETGTATFVISAANNKIFSGTTTLTDRTGTITAPTANNWKFVTYNSQFILGFQNSHAPIVATGIANFQNLSAVAGFTAPTTGDLNGGVALAAFGRVWALDSDGQTLHYSGSALNHMKWADADGAGKIQTQAYWPNGSDFVTGLAAWEDKLVVFGRHNILVYDSPEVPGSISLVDTISGVGCIARDTVAEVGTDVLFLSETGVRSLKKTFITTKAPVEDLSAAIRDYLAIYSVGSSTRVRAAYHQREGLYILLFPGATTTDIFCFDVKNLQQYQQLPSLQSIRSSQWKGFGRCNCLAYGRDEILYGGFRDESASNNAVIGKYDGYIDNTLTYTFKYYSPWMDLSNEQTPGTFLKIPKTSKVSTVGGGNYSVLVSWGYDFSNSEQNEAQTVTSSTALTEWGISEYGIGEFGSSTLELATTLHNLNGSGQFIRVGASYVINGYQISLQKIDVFLKAGRIAR